LELRENGLYCAAGDFYVDPWGPAERAVITHAHADHARPGADAYLTTAPGARLLRSVVGGDAPIEPLEYGERLVAGEATLSLHPAGHMLGSAQVRIEHRGEVWVVSGDYKLAADPTCAAYEPLRCHVFLTEATFALPIFRWPDPALVAGEIGDWRRACREAGKIAVLYAHPAGMAQRILASLDPGEGGVYCHPEVEAVNALYRKAGIAIPASASEPAKAGRGTANMAIGPPSARHSNWAKRFGPVSAAMASGWMRIRGPRRRRALDRGFVLSDHADWPALLTAIEESGAETVWVTHGLRAPLARWLQEQGRNSLAVDARFEGEREEEAPEDREPEAAE
jgi:putative mRNA 3-end processing factor